MTVREIAVGDLEGLLRLYTELHENPMPAQGETLSALWHGILAVSYTHLDVYKRQKSRSGRECGSGFMAPKGSFWAWPRPRRKAAS